MPSNDTDTIAEHHQQQQQQQPFSSIACRKHSKTTDDVLTSLSVVEAEISEEERQKRKEKGTTGESFEQLDRPRLTRSKSLDELDMAHNRMNPPTTLATVLENMPLVYNSTTKQLERVAQSSTANGSPLCAVASGNGAGESATAVALDGEQKTSKPFKRGHIRHSSYESSQIQLLATPVTAPFVGRTNSLNRTVMPSMGSLSLRDAECSTSAASIETGQTVDSAIGESVSSKRSSLDRKSQTSVVDWASDLESHSSPREDDGFADDDAGAAVAPDDRAAKRRGLPLPSISLPRGLFSRNKQTTTPSAAPWKLFGDRRAGKDPSIVSTTGLILENRPSNLPAKSEEEEARHRQQYLELIEAAKKKEHKEAKERKRAKELQRRLEDQAAAACRQWSEQILPKWEEMKNSKRCRELWWQGVPAKVRGRVWSLVIGNDLNLTEELYSICCARAKERLAQAAAEAEQAKHSSPDGSLCSVSKVDPVAQATAAPSLVDASSSNHKRSASSCVDHDSPTVDREGTVELIHLDVSRTFPSLGIFQKGGPYYDLLLNLVGAYVCYRPDVGYVQSMSFVAAVLLLQMEPYEAFVAFANLLNRPLQLAFFRLRQPQMTEYFIAYDQYFEQELPKLHAHFDQLDVRPDLYLIEWVYTLYAKSLPLDVTCRVWDMFLRDGEEFLFKTALGILRTFEQQLLVSDFDDVVQFLAHLPDSLTAAELFRNIEPFMRPYASTGESAKYKRRFLQILEDVNSRINPSPTADKLGHARRPSDGSQCSQLSQLSSNVQNVKMSKSLSGFLGDLLRPPPHEETA